MYATHSPSAAPLSLLKLWLILGILLVAVQQPRAVSATDDVANVSPCELESIINQLVNPNAEYQLHTSALRNQLKNILRERQLAAGEEQSLNDYDYPEEDKRSLAALAAQGLLQHGGGGGNKRSLATLAKNGQLPTPDPEEDSESNTPSEEKRYVGALARSGGFMGYGKRNIGTLARDFQLPNGKRNLANLARLGALKYEMPKRNVAAVARYNSQRMAAGGGGGGGGDKRNLGALKGSPVHGGVQQKREDEEIQLQMPGLDADYMDAVPNYWMYPSYADLDWNDYARAQKRFLDTSKDPELFGIENGVALTTVDDEEPLPMVERREQPQQQKRHIGAVYRSGFLPSYRALRSTTGSGNGGGGSGGGGGGRFSRSGRARQLVEYYPQLERLRQPIAAVCKRCFLPNRPVFDWGEAGIRGRLSNNHHRTVDNVRSSSVYTNALPAGGRRPAVVYSTNAANANVHSWGMPPRITALHRRSFRRPDYAMENREY